MPSRLKKKREALKFDAATGEIAAEKEVTPKKDPETPAVRQVVEVVEEEPVEPLETIKKDAKEIEEAVNELEKNKPAAPAPKVTVSEGAEEIYDDREEDEVLKEKATVESLFASDSSQASNEITAVSGGRSLGVWVGAMFGMALAIGLSLMFFIRGPQTLPFVTPTPSATPTPTVVLPSPTTTVINREDIKVSVLNGGGIPGAGARMRTLLESKGYTVVSVANASDYSFETTEVSVKPGQDEVAKLLMDDLKATYTLSSEAGTLEETETFDAQVIVGKE